MEKDRMASLLFIMIGAYAFFDSIHLPMGKWNQPGAGVFPIVLSVLLCILGVLIFFSGGGGKPIDWVVSIRQQGKPLQIIALSGAFIFLLTRVGYLVAAWLYLFGLFLWVGHFRLRMAIGLSLALSTGSWYFFSKLLALQLPRGPWGLW